jgi:hypothetical protein
MQLHVHRPAAIDVVKQHITTFTSMVAAGRRAGNGFVAILWQLGGGSKRQLRTIVCVILQGSLQSLCEALRSSVCGACRLSPSISVGSCSEYAHVRPASSQLLMNDKSQTQTRKIVTRKAVSGSKIVIFLTLKSQFFFCPAGAVQRGSVCTLSLIELVQCVSGRSHAPMVPSRPAPVHVHSSLSPAPHSVHATLPSKLESPCNRVTPQTFCSKLGLAPLPQGSRMQRRTAPYGT